MPKTKSLIFLILFVLPLIGFGCGSSGGGGDTPPEETAYTIGGMVSGLSGTVVLQNNGADDLTVAQNGAFTFTTSVADEGSYSVAIKTQPTGQICTVTNEAGTISGTNIANVSVTCIVPASGSLDTTFGTGGKVITQIGSGNDEAHAIAVQADGKIIAAGSWDNNSGDEEFALVRYNPDGTLDTAFGGDGRVTTEVDVNGSYVRAVAIQTDGKIVAAGDANDCFAVVRYNTDGSLDAMFDTDGIATTVLGSMISVRAMAIQSDGKIVVAGSSYEGGTGYDFAIVRYNPDGTPDLTFNGDGIVTTNVGSTSDNAYAMAIQSDGKIVVAGRWHNGTNYDIALARYDTDGLLDTTFDADGIATTSIGGNDDWANAIAIQSDGKLVVAVDFSNGTNTDIALVRYNPDGSLDTSLDTDGIAITAVGSGNDNARATAVQSDGKILIAGSAYNGADSEVALVRYNQDGSLDTVFDGDGIATTAVGGTYDYAYAIAVQSDARIIAAGYSDTGTGSDVVLVRYWP